MPGGNQRIGVEGQVWPMLFVGAERQHRDPARAPGRFDRRVIVREAGRRLRHLELRLLYISLSCAMS